DIGFLHYESVMFIYTIQFILVISAIPLMYENDIIVLAFYLFICASVFIFLTVCERYNYKIHTDRNNGSDVLTLVLNKYPKMKDVPVKLIESGLSLFIIASALIVQQVPTDFALSSLALLLLLSIVLFTGFLGYQLYRLILFVTIAFSVYLLTTYPSAWVFDEVDLVFIYFIVMVVLGFIAIRAASNEEFKITPLDYLVIAIALIIELLPGDNSFRESMIWMIVQIIILFYMCEIVVQNMCSRWNRFSGSVALALALVAYRGLT
ncbi:MAG: hypothetical protein RQ982_12980, partial [Gammaproteobacteria bacterium]|nr:hypothetical protein [Gammaproteobacteria bacterium]